MKLPLLNKITGTDARIKNIYVGREETVATDREVMAVHKTASLFGKDFASLLPKEGIQIKVEDWALLTTAYKSVDFDGLEILITRKGGKVDIVAPLFDLNNYPDYRLVLPKYEAYNCGNFTIDPDLLIKLYDALTRDERIKKLEVLASIPDGAIIIRAAYNPTAVGYLMPVTQENKNL